MSQPIQLNSWRCLEECAKSRQFNVKAQERPSNIKVHSIGIELDYKHQNVTPQIINLLIKLANECNLKEKIDDLFSGRIVNISEERPALHTALRIMEYQSLLVDGKNILPEIINVREQMQLIATQLRAGSWTGYSGKPITHIVNIGIGGSDLGPRLCLSALREYTSSHLNYYFISDADPKAFQSIVKTLNPETTLFIISSKSFTTYETLYNPRKAFEWIGERPNKEKHFIAVTAHSEKAKEFGISHILPIWDWVGGRYSMCSAINLITCIAIGFDAFMQLLIGANKADIHFKEQEFHNNIPVLLALLGIWNINFLDIHSLLMLLYTNQLELLVPYIQQLDMESNGKCIDVNGNKIDYHTGPIIWGGLGNQVQHSYYQLLSQSNHKIAADFISLKEYDDKPINSFCNAKINVLSEGVASINNPFGFIAGGMPINHIKLDACTPLHLGGLIALYEHKIFVQSVLWNINPFDQPGVESAKRAHKDNLQKL